MFGEVSAGRRSLAYDAATREQVLDDSRDDGDGKSNTCMYVHSLTLISPASTHNELV